MRWGFLLFVFPVFAQDYTVQRALIDKYCVTCHNQRLKTAGLTFDKMDLAHVTEDGKIWEEAVRKLRAGMMPPPGARQPEPAAVKSLVAWLETTLDAAAAKNPNPGRVALHRLNRTEYANAVQDLLGIPVDPSGLLPVDDISDGFDNIANVLKVSPSFLDQYIGAARFVAERAIGNIPRQPLTTSLRPSRGADQTAYVEGLPLGTRGGFVTEHNFPADGTYEFSIGGLSGAGYMFGLENRHKVILTIDGEKVFENQVGGEEDLKYIDQKQAPAVAAVRARFEKIKVPVMAGPHKVGVAFIARGRAENDNILQSFVPNAMDRAPRITNIDVVGPYNPTGISDTVSRKRIFVCKPPDPREDLPCANRILSNLARKAYRRPVTESDLAAPLKFFKEARATGNFDAGIQNGLTAILASPKFLYRTESAPEGQKPGAVYRISDLELASRLSFFLWSQNPDEKLLELASAGKLNSALVLDQQVKRMLADPRAKTLVNNFAFQWLNLRAISGIDPDPVQYPGYDPSLRTAFTTELELFIESIFAGDRPVTELLTANHTFVNERLALHYRIPNIRGSEFRRVALTDANRFGLLGKGGVLMVTSYPNRTAPVLRGAWILERILGTPPSPPPPNVEAFPETKEGAKVLTVRERMEQHRKNPTCNACHGIMDPLGFALENYDAVGEWRNMDRWAGIPIDSSGKLVDGTPVSGPADLRVALIKNPRPFVQTFTEKLMMYALGRRVEHTDMPMVRKIVNEVAPQNNRFSAIVLAIVKSAPFQMKQVEAEGKLTAQK